MIELIVMGVIASAIFGLIYYQNYRDKMRWQRIESGMSLFGDRTEVPLLELEGHKFNSHDRKVLVIWGDLTQSTSHNVTDARTVVQREKSMGKSRVDGVRIFVWNGSEWVQSK
jgi:hypothetical protein